MFAGFSDERIDVGGGVAIRARVAGEGRPVLLLHGYPQTHACWHRVAPLLVAAGFRVVAADLRGYGDSSKPASSADHAAYSKRAMAADQVAVMRALGHDRFAVAGHDRGGRVVHRMALDHPGAVRRLAVLDIAPTATMYARTDMAFATGYYHWFFLIQPAPLQERLIGADAEFYLRRKLAAWDRGPDTFAPEAFAEYLRCFGDPPVGLGRVVLEVDGRRRAVILAGGGDRRRVAEAAQVLGEGLGREGVRAPVPGGELASQVELRSG